MKKSLILGLMLTCLIAVAVGQNDETPIVLHKPTQADMAAARAAYAKMQNALPLEQKDVAYLIVDKSTFSTTPAFIDLSTSTAYEWKDVILQPSQVPNLIGTRSGSGLIVPIDPQQSGYQIKQIDPPIRYVALANSGKYGVGYYDPKNRIFYRWGNLEFDRNQLPADVESKNRILAPTVIANTSVIAPPSKYNPNSSKTTTSSPSSSEQLLPGEPVSMSPVPSTSEFLGLAWWLYGIIALGIVAIMGAGYYLWKKVI